MKITSKRVHILVCSTLGWGETKMCFSFPAVQFCGDLLENSSFRHRRREWQHVRNKRSSSPTVRTVAPRNEPQLKRAAMAGRRRPLWGRGAPATSPEGPAAPKGPLPRGPSGRETVESRLREVKSSTKFQSHPWAWAYSGRGNISHVDLQTFFNKGPHASFL